MNKKQIKTEGIVKKKDFDDLTRKALNTPKIKRKDRKKPKT